jgi:hypothetical protein
MQRARENSGPEERKTVKRKCASDNWLGARLAPSTLPRFVADSKHFSGPARMRIFCAFILKTTWLFAALVPTVRASHDPAHAVDRRSPSSLPCAARRIQH